MITKQSGLSSIPGGGAGAGGGGAARTRGTSPGGGGGASGISDAQKNAVRVMQRVMGELAMRLGGLSEDDAASVLNAVKDKGTIKDVATLKSYAQGFGATSMGYSGSSAEDGLWGSRTQKALIKIRDLVKACGWDGEISIEDGPTASAGKDEEIIKNANFNIDNIGRLFANLGLGNPSSLKGRGFGTEDWDRVGQILTQEGLVNPFGAVLGNIVVQAQHFDNLLSFFEFVVPNGIHTGEKCEPLPGYAAPKQTTVTEAQLTYTDLAKLASIIRGSEIIRLSADEDDEEEPTSDATEAIVEGLGEEGSASEGEGEEVSDEPAKPGTPWMRGGNAGILGSGPGLCINEFEAVLEWFVQRSTALYGTLANLAQNNRLNPLTKRRITEQELVTLNTYAQKARGLWGMWSYVKNALIALMRKIIKDNPGSTLAAEPKITKDILVYVLSRGGSRMGGLGGGAGRYRRHRGYGMDVPGSDEYGIDISQRGPLSKVMNFDELIEQGYPISDEIKNRLSWLRDHEVSLNEWQTRAWQDLAIQYAPPSPNSKEEDAADKYAQGNFQKAAQIIQDVIASLYREWSDMQPRPPRQLRTQQREMLSMWLSAIRRAVGRRSDTLSSGYGRPMYHTPQFGPAFQMAGAFPHKKE